MFESRTGDVFRAAETQGQPTAGCSVAQRSAHAGSSGTSGQEASNSSGVIVQPMYPTSTGTSGGADDLPNAGNELPDCSNAVPSRFSCTAP